VGTVKTRLNRARDLLRNRLARRGVALTPAILAGLLLTPASASAAVPAALSQATLQAATLFAAGKAAVGASAGVSALAEAAVHGMFLSKVKAVASIFLAVGLVGGGAGLAWQHKHSADVSANTKVVHESAALPTEEYPLEPTFPSTTVNYSKAPDVNVPGAAALSSRQGAELQRDWLPSRQDQYNEFVAEEEQARRAAEAKKNAPPPPPLPKAEETKTNPPSQSWWDWLWLPW
jgi:hypothetical protein